MRGIVYLIAVLAGISLSMEGAIGGTLGETIGTLESTYFVFIIGTFVVGLGILYFGKGEQLSKVFKIPRWTLLGGLFGITYLTILFISVPYLGVGVSMIAVIIGQIASSMVIEHFGWLGSKKTKIDIYRILATVSMAIALILVL